MWHDPEMTPMEKIQRLGEEVLESPCDLGLVTDENFKVKNVVMPSSYHTGNEVEGMPPISEESVKRAALVLPRVKSWGSSITKMYAVDTWSKILKDRQDLINPESIEDMMTTKAATEAIALLKKSQVQKVNEREFIKIRDFCKARLQLENGPGRCPFSSCRRAMQKSQRRSKSPKDQNGRKQVTSCTSLALKTPGWVLLLSI